MGFQPILKASLGPCYRTSRARINRSIIIKSLLLRLLAICIGIKILREEISLIEEKEVIIIGVLVQTLFVL